MSCNCIDNLDQKLAKHNTRIVRMVGFARDGRPAYARPKIDTEKIETRKRGSAMMVIPTFCPFCGTRYEPQPAQPAGGDTCAAS